MSPVRLTCLLSADFGEYVTASLFCRGQRFQASFIVPRAREPFLPADRKRFSVYDSLADAQRLIDAARPDVVLLASGYLFAVNGLASPSQLRELLTWLRRTGIAVMTTDPWFRIWQARPGTRFSIHSVRRGGPDAGMSERMNHLQHELEAMFANVAHVFAAPFEDRARRWYSFFNSAAAASVPARSETDWLFVLSKEDYTLLAGFEKHAFLTGLDARIAELIERRGETVSVIAPPEIGRFISERWPIGAGVTYLPFCGFDAFEQRLRGSKVVAYWNMLSSSLLYCLYDGVAPVLFGRGHTVRVCPGLETHAADVVYAGRPPATLELSEPLPLRSADEVRNAELNDWLLPLRAIYERSPAPDTVLEQVRTAA